MKDRASHGVTSIQLLVIAVAIAVVAAVLFPVLARYREKPHRQICQSNLKKIAEALEVYRQDWEDGTPLRGYYKESPSGHVPDFPPGHMYWFNVLSPYVKTIGIFRCPGQWWLYLQVFSSAHYTYASEMLYDDEMPYHGQTRWAEDKDGGYFWGSHYSVGTPVCYTMNGYLLGVKMSRVRDPSKTFMLWDAIMANKDTRDPKDGGPDRRPEPFGVDRWRADPAYVGCPHNGGHNYCFADGHVQWLAYKDVPWNDPRFYAGLSSGGGTSRRTPEE